MMTPKQQVEHAQKEFPGVRVVYVRGLSKPMAAVDAVVNANLYFFEEGLWYPAGADTSLVRGRALMDWVAFDTGTVAGSWARMVKPLMAALKEATPAYDWVDERNWLSGRPISELSDGRHIVLEPVGALDGEWKAAVRVPDAIRSDCRVRAGSAEATAILAVNLPVETYTGAVAALNAAFPEWVAQRAQSSLELCSKDGRVLRLAASAHGWRASWGGGP